MTFISHACNHDNGIISGDGSVVYKHNNAHAPLNTGR